MKLILIIIFNLVLGFFTRAQPVEQTFHLAEKEFSNREYMLARNNYNRVLFFCLDSTLKGIAVYKLAQCYFLENDLEKAKYFYDQAYFAATDDSLKYESLFQKVLCYFAESRYFEALNETVGIDVTDPYVGRRKHLFLASIYFHLEDFISSEKEFLALVPDSNGRKNVIALFCKVKRMQSRSCRKTQWMSIFLPGLGQFYNGEVKNGISSLAINSSLMALFTVVSIHYSVLNASLSIGPWLFRYYLGGARNAEKGCERKNERKREEILDKLVQGLTVYK